MPSGLKIKPTQILVVGGAGYIGSHMVDCLNNEGWDPVVVDNLSTGHADVLKATNFIKGDISDSHFLDELFKNHTFSAVMHFASFIEVKESVLNPAKYYRNNVTATLTLLEAMVKWKINNFIFSSTAAVYGEPQYTPIDENHPIAPVNPYGHSKRMVEQVLEDFSRAYDLRFISLRYFNAAGADPKGHLCERHEPESHLIPLILQTALKKRQSIIIHGNDYPTPDGTCIRDYVHVTDLCMAHLLALKNLLNGEKSGFYNLGSGEGFSVKEVINMARLVTQKDIPAEDGPRREGDPAILVAAPTLANKELNWHPKYSDLKTIIKHAWKSFN